MVLNWGSNAKGFYLLLYSISLSILQLAQLEMHHQHRFVADRLSDCRETGRFYDHFNKFDGPIHVLITPRLEQGNCCCCWCWTICVWEAKHKGTNQCLGLWNLNRVVEKLAWPRWGCEKGSHLSACIEVQAYFVILIIYVSDRSIFSLAHQRPKHAVEKIEQ